MKSQSCFRIDANCEVAEKKKEDFRRVAGCPSFGCRAIVIAYFYRSTLLLYDIEVENSVLYLW